MSSYEIYIRNETGKGTPNANGYNEPQLPTDEENPNKGGLKNLISKAGNAISYVQKGVDYQLEIITRNSNSNDIKTRTNATMSVIAQTLGVGMAFATGGPLAGLAAIGTSFFTQAKDIERQRYNAMWESIELEENRRRAGPNFNRGRTHDVF